MQSGELQVGEYLGLVDRVESLNRFEFDDHQAVDSQIQPEPAIDPNPPVDNRQLLLALDKTASVEEFVFQTRFVSGLQKPWTKFLVNGYCCSDNQFGKLIERFSHFCFPFVTLQLNTLSLCALDDLESPLCQLVIKAGLTAVNADDAEK